MFYVLAAYYARGRFLSAVRQSAPSGTSRRGFETPGLRLLVTGSTHYTIKIASAVSRRRRKSKIVHAQRPDQIPPRALLASPAVFPAQAGTQGKTKHAVSPYPTTPRPKPAETSTIASSTASHSSSISPAVIDSGGDNGRM